MTTDTCSGRERITSFTPTLCALMGVDSPDISSGTVLQPVVDEACRSGVTTANKALIFAPDAVGTHLYEKYTGEFDTVLRHAPVRVPLCSVMPSKTPICYSSIFTGAMPEAHGVTKAFRPRPVLVCDTLFDALIRAGKRCAIIAITNCSIDRLFRNRDMDYIACADDSEVHEATLSLLRKNEHDVVTVYNAAVDKRQHATGPWSDETAQALRNNIANFAELVQTVNDVWKNEDRVVTFTPDHGGHLVEGGKGTHGDDIPEDMHVEHFFGIYRNASDEKQ